jgi:hypothetical protein
MSFKIHSIFSKKNHAMKYPFILFLLLLSNCAFAQLKGAVPQPNAPEHIKKERKKPANTPTAKALEVSTKLTKTLGLNEVQQKDLHAAILDYETNVTNVNKSNLSKKDKYNKIHTLNMKRQARLKAILTPEQYKTYILSFP